MTLEERAAAIADKSIGSARGELRRKRIYAEAIKMLREVAMCLDCAVSEMGLRDRCKDMVGRMQRNAIMRQGSPVDDLTAFVVSEIGRAASSKLEDSLPLCLYFDNEQDRAEFVAAVHEAKPGMISKQWPR